MGRASGGYMVAVTDGFATVDFDGHFEMLASVEADVPDSRMNDGKYDSDGRFWAGTTRMTHDTSVGTFYRLDADHSVHPMVSDVWISNGLDWTDDDQQM